MCIAQVARSMRSAMTLHHARCPHPDVWIVYHLEGTECIARRAGYIVHNTLQSGHHVPQGTNLTIVSKRNATNLPIFASLPKCERLLTCKNRLLAVEDKEGMRQLTCFWRWWGGGEVTPRNYWVAATPCGLVGVAYRVGS